MKNNISMQDGMSTALYDSEFWIILSQIKKRGSTKECWKYYVTNEEIINWNFEEHEKRQFGEIKTHRTHQNKTKIKKTMKSLCKQLKEKAPERERKVKDKKEPPRAKEEQKTMESYNHPHPQGKRYIQRESYFSWNIWIVPARFLNILNHLIDLQS